MVCFVDNMFAHTPSLKKKSRRIAGHWTPFLRDTRTIVQIYIVLDGTVEYHQRQYSSIMSVNRCLITSRRTLWEIFVSIKKQKEPKKESKYSIMLITKTNFKIGKMFKVTPWHLNIIPNMMSLRAREQSGCYKKNKIKREPIS